VAYRLLVADLDGTLRSRTLGVTDGVREAVARAQARGVRVCVATGRMWPSAAPWVTRIGADSPAILYNGGQVRDFAAGRVLWERRLPRDVAREALALVRREAGARIHLYADDRVYVERPDPLTEAYAADDGVKVDLVPALESLLDRDPYKMLLIGPPDSMAALGVAVRAALPGVHAVQSEPQYLEILPAGVSKGAALDVLLETVGIPREEVVAVGDNWNDLEMIEAAGLGVAMGHAPAGVRARAGHVCGTSEDEGVRQVIERFFL
jgi:Cof subfamily protein (haloacid dehalogenase superfamily)